MSKGTLISRIIPCKIANGTKFFPEYRYTNGNITSIELMPAAEIGANLPKNRVKKGAPNNEIISRMIFANKANVPNSAATCTPTDALLISVISTDERE